MSNTNLTVVINHGQKEIVTISEEHASELVNKFCETSRQGLDLLVTQAETLAELRASKGYLHLGYTSFYNDKDSDTPLLKALFGEDAKDSDTEAKNLCLLATTFGAKQYDNDKNSLDKWVISDRNRQIMRNASKGFLYELPALKECGETDVDLETLLGEVFGLLFDEDGQAIESTIGDDGKRIPLLGENGETTLLKLPTVRAIREVKALERQFKLPYNEALVEKEKLDAQAKAVSDNVAENGFTADNQRQGTEEPTEGTLEPTEGTEEPTEEPTEGTEEPINEPVEDIKEISLKEAKSLLKSGIKFAVLSEQGIATVYEIK